MRREVNGLNAKTGLISLFAAGILIAIAAFVLPNLFVHLENEGFDPNAHSSSTPEKWPSVKVFRIEDKTYVWLSEWAKLVGFQPLQDQLQGTVSFSYKGQAIELLKGSPTVSVGGLFYPLDGKPRFEKEGILVPADLVMLLEGKDNAKLIGNDKLAVRTRKDEAIPVGAVTKEIDLKQASPEVLSHYLQFLNLPIEGARVSTKSSHLPGAPRPYRNGTHEGIDWYAGTTGVDIVIGTPIYAMADGTVVRADHDYIEMSLLERNGLLELSKQVKDTPLWILDKMRGRSVWIQHDHGVMVRYVHLNSIPEEIVPGAKVKKGQLIGTVGNSGTSYGLEKSSEGAHLHSDILIYGELFWKYLKQEEIRMVLESVFDSKLTASDS